MVPRLVFALALALMASPGPAAATTLRPSKMYTREGDRVRDRVLEVRAGARAVVRFDLRSVRRRPPRAELRLDLRRVPSRGTLVVATTGGAEIGEARLPGRGRRIVMDVTPFVRTGRTLSIVLSRTGAASFVSRGALRPRILLRRSATPPDRPPPAFAPAPAGSVAVGAAGDVACSPRTTGYNRGAGTWTECRQAMTAEMLEAGSLDAVLALGDLQYQRGGVEDFRAVYQPTWGRLRAITHPIVGNHEYETPGAAGYWDYFGASAGTRGEGWYSFDIGAWHVVALNANCAEVACEAGSPQERWLRADLAASGARCTLAMLHQPRFTSGPNDNGLLGYPQVSALWQALQDAGAELALGGHMHNYERFPPMTPAGVPDASGLASFVVGTGGRNLYHAFERHPASAAYSASVFGYLRLVLHPDRYDWRFVAEPGRDFRDAGSAACR